ncbi:MAG: hypothetical protein GEV28_26625 [Actinophytocola sp.]|uniref:hypothetical protein n=1 Tax=Actinophytocola sp. TaxID=1872138 RepID=UPI00132C7E72|nr:hypothetical protein [Actinophytocola sp.]MPZ83774.1 hypothetical protein [Actinophytocola sp.]
MRSLPRPRRALGAALVTAMVAGAVGLVAAAPAGAGTTVDIRPASWARTDSRAPHQTITTGDALVGAWRDAAGKVHKSKSYFTFDLTRLRGTDVQLVELGFTELAVTDCAKPRATELWLTTPATRPTWADQPKELVKLPGPDALGCPWSFVEWDGTDVVRAALKAGKTSITLVLRMAERRMGDVAYGRTHATDPAMIVTRNTPPAAPTTLRVGQEFSAGHDCAEPDIVLGGGGITVSGEAADPDGESGLRARISFWATDNPVDTREVVTSVFGDFGASFPADLTSDGGAYAWRARAEDGDGAVSAWTAPCMFTIDRTAPDAPPTVESADYPENGGPPGSGGDGVAGEFTFTANGVADVVRYEWEGIGVPGGSTDAAAPGGPATVSITPASDGPLSISVRSVDRAGNRSESRTYRFWVRATAPEVSLEPRYVIGDPVDPTFTARQDGAVTFTYRLDEGPEVAVPVGADGTARVVLDVPRTEPYHHQFAVWSTTAAGQRSGVTERSFQIDPAIPEITGEAPNGMMIGEPIRLTFTPGMAGVVSYTWWVDDGTRTTVPAEPDGTAGTTYVPTVGGFQFVNVFSTTSAGVESGVAWAQLVVADGAPEVTSEQYPEWSEGGGPGTPGTFAFDSPLPGVVEYRYVLNDGAEQTVAAGADGTASAELTPTAPGRHVLRVRAGTASGLVSGERTYEFYVQAVGPVVTGPSQVTMGVPAEFAFAAQLAGSTEFGYQVDGGEKITVAVADGAATVRVTATEWGQHVISVESRTPEGVVSGASEFYFYAYE